MRDPGPTDFIPNPLSPAARAQRRDRFMRRVCYAALAWTVLCLSFAGWVEVAR
jgi:hypothetical protein